MKLSAALALTVAGGLTLAACGSSETRTANDEAVQGEAWLTPPVITGVEQRADGLIVRGDAAPGARVVLRTGQTAGFAASADKAGRFEIQMPSPDAALILIPEIQAGQMQTPGREQLLLIGGSAPLSALLSDGGASRRLGLAPLLDAVDGDGRGLVVSGRAEPGVEVTVMAGGMAVHAVAGDDRRWTASLSGVGDRSLDIKIGERVFDYPGPAGVADGLATRAGEGWRLTRALSPSARQTSWFPDA